MYITRGTLFCFGGIRSGTFRNNPTVRTHRETNPEEILVQGI